MEGWRMSRWLKPALVVPEICAALNRERAEYLVIGGVAGVLHGAIRIATDLDLLIARNRENATRVLLALSAAGYGYASEWLPAEIVKQAITVIGDDPSVNLLTAAHALKYEDVVARAGYMDADGVRIPVLGLDDLMASKRTGRPLDTADIKTLEIIKSLRGG